MEYAYHVSEQQEHGIEKQIAGFANENDAYTFLQAKVEWGEKMHLRQIYRVYHEKEEINTRATFKMSTTAGKTTRFHPTPLGTKPVPVGMRSSFVDEDEEE